MPGPKIKLWPPAFQINRGRDTISGRKKRIVEIMLRLHNTKSIEVNGQLVPFRKMGDNLLDQEIPLFSGEKYIEGNRGWDEQPQVTITQPEPQPMTVLGVLQEVGY
jgi:hypothetical protein